MFGSNSNRKIKGKLGKLISLFENRSNSQETRKPHTGTRPTPPVHNKRTVPSNTLSRIKERPYNTETNHGNESAGTFDTQRQDENLHTLNENSREKGAHFQEQMTAARTEINENNDFDPVKVVELHQSSIYRMLQILIKTEEEYIVGLKLILNEYLPYIDTHSTQSLTRRIPSTFEYIERICRNAETFLRCLRDSPVTVDNIAEIFINKASDFELYSFYPKLIPTAYTYLRQFDDLLELRKTNLNDKLGLTLRLLSPIRRMENYFFLLKKMQNELEKSSHSSQKLDDAISLVSTIKKIGSDYIVIDSIKNSELSYLQHGSFITKSRFRIVKPKRFTSTVFLFENVVVFTKSITKTSENFTYVDSILTSDLRLEHVDMKEGPTVFKLTNYSKLMMEKAHATYTLEAESANTKDEWIKIVRDILWSHFQKAKRAQGDMDGFQLFRTRSCMLLPIKKY